MYLFMSAVHRIRKQKCALRRSIITLGFLMITVPIGATEAWFGSEEASFQRHVTRENLDRYEQIRRSPFDRYRMRFSQGEYEIEEILPGYDAPGIRID